MIRFWLVMRYKDESLQRHPNYGERNVYYMGDINGERGRINHTMFPSLEAAEADAVRLAQEHPTESVVVLEQKSVYELPTLPAPIKKKLNARGELVPDA